MDIDGIFGKCNLSKKSKTNGDRLSSMSLYDLLMQMNENLLDVHHNIPAVDICILDIIDERSASTNCIYHTDDRVGRDCEKCVQRYLNSVGD